MRRCVFALLLPLPASASAQEGSEALHGVVHQGFLALLNPMGMQHRIGVGVRARLGEPSELLFGGAHVEAGAISYVAPVFAIHGAYLQVSPLSFLVLRAEVAEMSVWPLGLEGAGYFTMQGYGDDFGVEARPADAASAADGWNVRLRARLQAAAPIGDARLLASNTITFEHDTLGSATHYYSPRHDLVLARQDWVVLNDALVVAEIPLAPDVDILAGAYSNLRWVPRSGYLGHQVGPLLAVKFEHPADSVDTIGIFVRGGWYTHHGTRGGQPTLLGGLSVDYDLGGLR